MGLADWYDRRVMPRLIVCACATGHVMKRRAAIVPLARGDVFELGCGGGINVPLYDANAVASYAGIDPHAGLLAQAKHVAREHRLTADLRAGVGEDIPFRSRTFDTVVCTFTLCSVSEPPRVLRELRRVLRPGGRLLFLEHGRAPDAGTARWQRRIEPGWKRIAGGCHLTRSIGAAVRGAGFEVEPIGQGYLPRAPRFAGWNEWGVARAPGV